MFTIQKQKNFFSKALLKWDSAENHRKMPWKSEKDPYKIWLSEIILQQTRVAQGLSYYNHFIQHYPTLKDLAKATDSQVFKSWEGLGYYNRCRNMLHTARFIVNELDGKFPTNYEDILALKGIGTYTAAAIASFAWNLPYAVVDGNVIRVLSRVFGIDTAVDTSTGKQQMITLAQELLDTRQPGRYNQAIMDFGATLCTPKSPQCSACPFRKTCVAFQENRIEQLPVKSKKRIKKKRYFHYFIANYKDKFYIRERTGKDIWQHLNEFILLETNKSISLSRLLESDFVRTAFADRFRVIHVSKPVQQELTHQQIQCRFIRIELSKPLSNPNYTLIPRSKIHTKAFPKIIRENGLGII